MLLVLALHLLAAGTLLVLAAFAAMGLWVLLPNTFIGEDSTLAGVVGTLLVIALESLLATVLITSGFFAARNVVWCWAVLS